MASAFASLSSFCSQGKSCRILSFYLHQCWWWYTRSYCILLYQSKPGFIIYLVFQTFPLCFDFKCHWQIYCFIICFMFLSELLQDRISKFQIIRKMLINCSECRGEPKFSWGWQMDCLEERLKDYSLVKLMI